jgi:response regulator RpfG family c-di-GMP phosphodiesterase
MRAEATAHQFSPDQRGDVLAYPRRTADLLIELAPTLDASAGQPAGHAVRTCYLAMRLAEALSISDRDRLGLFYAALLHDAGSVSAPAASRSHPAMLRRLMPIARGTDDERLAAEHLRVRRGAQFATRAGLGPEVAVTVMALHERWDGRGLPMGLSGETIPIFARIVALVDGLDQALTDEGRRGAVTTVHARSGTWYDPELASVLLALCGNGLLNELATEDLESLTRDLEPNWLVRLADAEDRDRIRGTLMLVDED